MSNQRRAAPAAPPYLPGDEHREVLSVPEPNEVVLPVRLSSDLADRVNIWRADHTISRSEAIARLIEAGLERLSQKPTRRGPKNYWGEVRYLVLHHQVSVIMAELQAGRKSKVSVREAVEVLRERRPNLWKNAPSSLVTKFHEAERKLKAYVKTQEVRSDASFLEIPED